MGPDRCWGRTSKHLPVSPMVVKLGNEEVDVKGPLHDAAVNRSSQDATIGVYEMTANGLDGD